MSLSSSRPVELDRVLVEAVGFLLERTRAELDSQQPGQGSLDAGHLGRVRSLEEQLHACREQMGDVHEARGPQVSRFWETPGQEDA